MKKASIRNILYWFFIAVFILGVAIPFIGREISIRDNKDFKELQAEFFAPDTISTVLYDGELHQIYVCYTHASYVNVYTESGEFLWAVSVPYMRYGIFELADGELLIYSGNDDVLYKYRASNGEFVGTEDVLEKYPDFDWTKTPRGKADPKNFYHDNYVVYRCDEYGNWEAVVSRPAWYGVFNSVVWIPLSFASALGFGMILFLNKRKEYLEAKKRMAESGIKMEDKKARLLLGYYKITAIIHFVYVPVNIICAAFGYTISMLLIVFFSIHYILSTMILGWVIEKNIAIDNDQQKILSYWFVVELVSFMSAFVSVIVAVGVAG